MTAGIDTAFAVVSEIVGHEVAKRIQKVKFDLACQQRKKPERPDAVTHTNREQHFSSPFANMPGIAIDDPCPAIDGEMSVGQIREKKPMILKASAFDGLVDGIEYREKYFSL